MRTPWKLLYDWTNAIIGPNWGYAWQLQQLVGGLVVMTPIIVVTWVISVIAKSISPTSAFAQFLENHFWSVVFVSAVVFFFYWFFRLVWDGLKEPTVQQTELKKSDG